MIKILYFVFLYLSLSCSVSLDLNEHTFHAEKNIVFVSAYFPLAKSKHSSHEYIRWIRSFFQTVQTNTFIFTAPDALKDLLTSLEGTANIYKNDVFVIEKDNYENYKEALLRKSKFVFITAYKNATEFPCMQDIYQNLSRQHIIDTEKTIHNPNLYSIWTSKPWMVNRVALLKLFSPNTYYFWIDIGTQRNTLNFGNWPDKETVIKNLSFHNKTILTVVSTGLKGHFDKKGRDVFVYGKHPTDFVIGGYFGCQTASCEKFSKKFYLKQKEWLKYNYFAGKEQNLLDSLALDAPSDYLALNLKGVFPDFQNTYYKTFWTYFANPDVAKMILGNRNHPHICNISELL